MKPAFLIALREYTENAKTKGFWIGLIFVPLLLLVTSQLPMIIEKKATPIRYFVLVDQSQQFDKIIESGLDRAYQFQARQALSEFANSYAKPDSKERVKTQFTPQWNGPGFRQSEELFPGTDAGATAATNAVPQTLDKIYALLKPFLKADAPEFKPPRRHFERIALPPSLRNESDLASLAQQLKPFLRGQKKIEANGERAELYAAVLIPADIEKNILRDARAVPAAGDSGIQYWSSNLADTKLREEIERLVNREVRRREIVARGLDAAAVNRVLQTSVPFVDLNPKKEAGQEKVSLADRIRQWAPSGFVYLLWLAIFSIIQMLLNNTIEEKSNRLIEMLLSSVTPGELMMGKLAGIAAIGLTLVGSWLIALLAGLSWKSSGESEIARQLLVAVRTSHLMPIFVVYFCLGFLLYAGIILAIGSVCNTIKEAQNYMAAITMLMIVPLMTMTFIPRDPNGVLATTLSWIPIYTPFVMMNRATADPPLRDLVGTMLLMLVTTALVLWLSGKIFRIGILRTGQPPKLLELLRWLRS